MWFLLPNCFFGNNSQLDSRTVAWDADFRVRLPVSQGGEADSPRRPTMSVTETKTTVARGPPRETVAEQQTSLRRMHPTVLSPHLRGMHTVLSTHLRARKYGASSCILSRPFLFQSLTSFSFSLRRVVHQELGVARDWFKRFHEILVLDIHRVSYNAHKPVELQKKEEGVSGPLRVSIRLFVEKPYRFGSAEVIATGVDAVIMIP